MTSHNILTSPAPPESVLEHIKPGADVIMPNANGEAVKLVDTLPREDSGKIMKRKLREPYWASAGRRI